MEFKIIIKMNFTKVIYKYTLNLQFGRAIDQMQTDNDKLKLCSKGK